ncbi:MAG: hypothetical protein QQN63_06890 [Nitrosopumilus sp.]
MPVKRVTLAFADKIWRSLPLEKRIQQAQSLFTERMLTFLYVIVIVVFSGGVVNALLEGSKLPPTVSIFLGPTVQTLGETVIFSFITLFGTAGIYMIYAGAKRPITDKITDLLIITGLIMAFMATFLALFILQLKGFF